MQGDLNRICYNISFVLSFLHFYIWLLIFNSRYFSFFTFSTTYLRRDTGQIIKKSKMIKWKKKAWQVDKPLGVELMELYGSRTANNLHT